MKILTFSENCNFPNGNIEEDFNEEDEAFDDANKKNKLMKNLKVKNLTADSLMTNTHSKEKIKNKNCRESLGITDNKKLDESEEKDGIIYTISKNMKKKKKYKFADLKSLINKFE